MQIDDTNRTDPRIGHAHGARLSSRVGGGAGTEFARVFELADARRARPLPAAAAESIPAEVWAEVDRAHRLADELAARGQRVSFETHRLSGKVVASLCDSDGGLLRPLPLTELVPSSPQAPADEAVV